MQPEREVIARLPRALVKQVETHRDVAERILIGERLSGLASRHQVQTRHALPRVLLRNKLPGGVQIV